MNICTSHPHGSMSTLPTLRHFLQVILTTAMTICMTWACFLSCSHPDPIQPLLYPLDSSKPQVPIAALLCPDRDTLLGVSARYLWIQWVSGSVVQWFRRGLDDQVETEDERDQRSSVETMNCQSKTKTKLRSTTDTEAILIVESPQLIVNKRTQVRHYESYGKG